MRGKIGGQVYSDSQFNAITSHSYNGSPNYPNSTGQQAAKSSFVSASDAWEGLTDSERQSWSAYAKSLETVKSFATAKLTGRLAFIKVMSVFHYYKAVFDGSFTVDYSVPTETGIIKPPFMTQVTYAVSGNSGIRIKYVNYTADDLYVFYQLSAPYSLAVNRLDGPFLYSLKDSVGINADDLKRRNFTLTAAYEGKVVFGKFRFITQNPPYRVSNILKYRFVVDTVP